MTESVYAIIKEEPPAPGKAPRYQSIRKGKEIPPTYSTFGTHGTSVVCGNVGGYADTDVPCVHPAKKPVGSFGKPVAHTIDAKQFLKMSGNRGVLPQKSSPPRRSGSGSGGERGNGNEEGGDQDQQGQEQGQQQGNKQPRQKAFQYHDANQARPPVPLREEKPIMGLKSDKNFVVANAVENMLAVPKKPPVEPGRALDNSTFGKVPPYVKKRKAELAEHNNMISETLARQAREAEVFYKLSAAELKELRDSLQARWDTLNREFQTMGFQVETRSQKKRQEQLERELRVIEAAQAKLKRDNIYIYDEDK